MKIQIFKEFDRKSIQSGSKIASIEEQITWSSCKASSLHTNNCGQP